MSRMHTEIIIHDYVFDQKNIDIKILEDMIAPELIQQYKEKLIKMFKTTFIENPRKLTLQMVAPNHKDQQASNKFSKDSITQVMIDDINKENEDDEIIPLKHIIQDLDIMNDYDQNWNGSTDNGMYYEDVYKARWLKKLNQYMECS